MHSLISSDFTSIENKAEIRRKIISALGLTETESQVVETSFFMKSTTCDIKSKINLFNSSFPEFYSKLFNTTISGFGPGEILLYFLIDDLYLSGFTSSIDAYVGNKPFAEIKAVKKSFKLNWYYDFRFGSFSNDSNQKIISTIKNFVNHVNNPLLIDSELEINRTKIKQLQKIKLNVDEYSMLLKVSNGDVYIDQTKIGTRADVDFASKIQNALDHLSTKTPSTFKELEDAYFNEILLSPEGKNNFIFFDKRDGMCVYHGKLSREMLAIERITQGRVKPFIKLM